MASHPVLVRWPESRNEIVVKAWPVPLRLVKRYDPNEARNTHGEWGADTIWHSLNEVLEHHPHVQMHISEDHNGIRLSLIRVDPDQRGGGKAGAALTDLIHYADQKNKPIALTPDPLGSGGLSKTALTKWYSSRGFVPNKGRHKDFAFTEAMIRQPRG